MKVLINGEERDVPEAGSVMDVLRHSGYEGKSVAVALNGDFVTRSLYAETKLKENDALEIVAPMAGG